MKTVTEMAKEAGAMFELGEPHGDMVLVLERFAELVRADEREACAKVCEANIWSRPVAWWREATKSDVSAESGLQCAAAIRARGQDPMPLFDDWPGAFKHDKQ